MLFGASWQVAAVSWLGLGLGGLCLLSMLGAMRRHWRTQAHIRRMLAGADAFGRSDFATAADVMAAGLAGRRSAEGLFLGALDGELLFYPPQTHLLTIAPAGGGKTSAVVVPNVLHMAAQAPAYGALVTDKDGEVAQMCWRFVQQRLPGSVCLNPYGLHGLPNHRLNRLQEVLDLARADDPAVVETARARLAILIPEPEKAGDNAFFRATARDLGCWVAIFLAYETPEQCHLPGLYAAIGGGEADLIGLFRAMQASNAAAGEVARAGARFLALMHTADRTFGGVLAELQQALSLWDGFSTLGRSTLRSDFAPAVLRQGPAMAFLVIPEERAGVIGRDTALVVDSFVRAAMRHPQKHPRAVFLLDEFQRLPPMGSIPDALYRGRGSGLTVWPFVQDGRSLKAYGKDESAFRTQADVVQMFAVRDVADAQYLETRIGQRTATPASLSLPQAPGRAADWQASYGQQAVPRLRKDEVLRIGPPRQFLVHRADPVILAALVPWWQVEPLRRWPADNPKEGGRPTGRARFFLRYRKAAGRVRQVRLRHRSRPGPGFLAPLRREAVQFVRWFWLPGAVLAAALAWGTPSVLWSYGYRPGEAQLRHSHCTWLGLDGHRRSVPAGRCGYVAVFPLRLPGRGFALAMED